MPQLCHAGGMSNSEIPAAEYGDRAHLCPSPHGEQQIERCTREVPMRETLNSPLVGQNAASEGLHAAPWKVRLLGEWVSTRRTESAIWAAKDPSQMMTPADGRVGRRPFVCSGCMGNHHATHPSAETGAAVAAWSTAPRSTPRAASGVPGAVRDLDHPKWRKIVCPLRTFYFPRLIASWSCVIVHGLDCRPQFDAGGVRVALFDRE